MDVTFKQITVSNWKDRLGKATKKLYYKVQESYHKQY